MGSTNQVCLLVDVEVDAVNGSTHVLILEHTLSTISEWDDRQAVSAYRNCLSEVVHLWIAHTFWCHVAAHPSVEDTRAIDAEEHTQTGCTTFTMIHVCKGVHARELVVIHLAKHTIHHT